MKGSTLRRQSVPVTILSSALVLLVAGCSTSAPPTSATPTTGTPKNQPCIIGGTPALSGPSAFMGPTITHGGDMAAEELASSDSPVKLVWEDGQNAPQQSVSAYNKLVSVDKAKVVIIQGTDPLLAMAPLSQRDQVVLFNISATTPKQVGLTPLLFGNPILATTEHKSLALYAADKLGAKRVVVVANDNEYGKTASDVVKKTLEEKGVTVVALIKISPTGSDFRGQMAAVAGEQVDAGIMLSVGPTGGIAIKHATEVGLKPKQWLGDSFSLVKEAVDASGGATEGAIQSSALFDTVGSPKAKKFHDDYVAKYKSEPDIFAARTYDAVYALSQAAKGGCSGPAIAGALKQMSAFEGVLGKVDFSKNGIAEGQLGFYQITGTTRKLLGSN